MSLAMAERLVRAVQDRPSVEDRTNKRPPENRAASQLGNDWQEASLSCSCQISHLGGESSSLHEA